MKHTFEEVYAMYKNKIQSHIQYRIRNKETVEDLTSEVFLKVYRFLDTYDETKGQLSTWVYTIANNLMIDYFRQKKLETTNVSDFITEDGMDLFANHCTHDTPHNVLVNKEIRENVQSKLQKLPSNLLRVAELFFNEDLNYQEIGEALNIPLGTVKAYIFRARAILQDQLDTLVHA
jgi:RNA polymerase sigma factor (sigma-70 family)